VKTVFGDLRDHFAVRKVVREVQPDAVVHLGSISAVSYSYDHPIEVMETNFLGTVNMAESCLREVPHFKHFLFAGTSEEYGKDNTHFVVERTIAQMLGGKTVKLGDPKPVRDFMYSYDHANSYLTCLENQKSIGEIFNFCTGRGVSIAELAESIKGLTGFESEVIWDSIPERPLDIAVLVGDYSKAKRILGWEPKFRLEDGLRLTIDFWKNNLVGGA